MAHFYQSAPLFIWFQNFSFLHSYSQQTYLFSLFPHSLFSQGFSLTSEHFSHFFENYLIFSNGLFYQYVSRQDGHPLNTYYLIPNSSTVCPTNRKQIAVHDDTKM